MADATIPPRGYDKAFGDGQWATLAPGTQTLANQFYAGRVYSTSSEQALLQSFRLKEPDAVVGNSILIFNLDPSDPQVNLSLGTIMALRGQWAPAEELLQKVLPSPQFSGAAREILAQVRARQGKNAELPNQQNQAGDVQLLPKATTRSR